MRGLIPFPRERQIREQSSSTSGGSGNMEDRVRAIELDLAAIKNELKHLASKAWILGGILAGMGVAAGVAVALATLIFRIAGQSD